MEGQLCANSEIYVEKPLGASPPSFIALLKIYRELLVSKIRNTQCLIDNLIKNDYFSTEDAEIVAQFPTQADKVFFLFHISNKLFVTFILPLPFMGLSTNFTSSECLF